MEESSFNTFDTIIHEKNEYNETESTERLENKMNSIIATLNNDQSRVNVRFDDRDKFSMLKSIYNSQKNQIIRHLMFQTMYIQELSPYRYHLIYMWTKNCNNVCKVLRNLIMKTSDEEGQALLPGNSGIVEDDDIYYAYFLWRGYTVRTYPPDDPIVPLIQQAKRDGITVDRLLGELLNDVEILKNTIHDAPRPPEDLIFSTTRGVCGNALISALSILRVHEYYIEFTPLSTTIDIDIAEGFSREFGEERCNILQYIIGKDTPSLFVEQATYFDSEFEVTLPPFSIYRKLRENGTFMYTGTFEYRPINMGFGSKDTLVSYPINTFSHPTKRMLSNMTSRDKFPQLANRVFISREEEKSFEHFLRDKHSLSVLNDMSIHHGEKILHTAIFFER
jgi:hypothetical protein